MARDLSGLWTADDGGTYYLQQFEQTLWWLGQSDDGSLQRGLVFTNIFRGTVSSGGVNTGTDAGVNAQVNAVGIPPDNIVFGAWADVPRGGTMNFGDLSLAIDFDSAGNPIQLTRLVETGGFSGTTWTFQTNDLDRTFPSISDLFGQIVKNTWHVDDPLDIFDPDRETLADNLEVVKEPVVLFATLRPGEITAAQPFINSFPPSEPRTRQQFLDLNDPYDTAIFNTDSADADMTCHLTIDPADLPTDLFNGMSDQHRQEVQQKIGSIHPEMVMFARAEDDDAPALLPGWGELDGNSILFNGIPINGICEITENQSVISIGRNALIPFVGQPVRITGVMSIDIGHDERPLEIHPVYAFELITATPRDDWSGVWGDSNGFSYYIHQVFNTFWIFITSPFRDLTFVAVFQGEIQADNVTVRGDWSTVSISGSVGFGQMTFQLDPGKLKIAAGGPPLAGRVLRKLYDANGHPCPPIGGVAVQVQGARICEVKEIEGASVIYRVVAPGSMNLPGIHYRWTTTGGRIAGSNSLSTVEVIALPSAGTPVTVAVDVTTVTGCRYHGERPFITKSRAEATRLQLWCELRQSVVASVNKYLAPARVSQPPQGSQPEPPDRATLDELHQALARIQELLNALRHHRME